GISRAEDRASHARKPARGLRERAMGAGSRDEYRISHVFPACIPVRKSEVGLGGATQRITAPCSRTESIAPAAELSRQGRSAAFAAPERLGRNSEGITALFNSARGTVSKHAAAQQPYPSRAKIICARTGTAAVRFRMDDADAIGSFQPASRMELRLSICGQLVLVSADLR